jgi:hypothetical protein
MALPARRPSENFTVPSLRCIVIGNSRSLQTLSSPHRRPNCRTCKFQACQCPGRDRPGHTKTKPTHTRTAGRPGRPGHHDRDLRLRCALVRGRGRGASARPGLGHGRTEAARQCVAFRECGPPSGRPNDPPQPGDRPSPPGLTADSSPANRDSR